MHTPNEDKMFAGSAAPPRYSAAPPRYSTVAQSHTHAHHHTAPHKAEAEEDEEVIREVDDMTQWIPRPPDRQGIPQYRRLAVRLFRSYANAMSNSDADELVVETRCHPSRRHRKHAQATTSVHEAVQPRPRTERHRRGRVHCLCR